MARVLGKWRMEVQCSKLNLKKTDVAQMQADGAMGLRIGQVEKHKSNFAQRAKLIEKRTKHLPVAR